ncbi:MAG TPA: hypothetical protein VK466_12455 [Terriglobales bacterium]|nr:hypothetical protein [Terriglobales bacterium]
MTRPRPHCDRHPNLQMVPCWLRRGRAVIPGHACPVPGCGRYHAQEGYLNAADVELALGPQDSVRKKAPASETLNRKSSLKAAGTAEEVPLNRHTAARAAILKAIESKRES